MDTDPSDLYALLGVADTASREAIRLAYHRLAREHHPDFVSHLGTDAEERAAARMAELNEAYAVLSQEESREAYDRRRRMTGDRGGAAPSLREVRTATARAAPPPPPPPGAAGPRPGFGAAPGAATSAVEKVAELFLGRLRQAVLGGALGASWRDASVEGFDWALRATSLVAQEWLVVRSYHHVSPNDVRRFHRHAEAAVRAARGGLRRQRFAFVLAYYAPREPAEVERSIRRCEVALRVAGNGGDVDAELLVLDVASGRAVALRKLAPGSLGERVLTALDPPRSASRRA